ncbi:MAG: DUF2505 family protein [Polyangiaceae bacterium]
MKFVVEIMTRGVDYPRFRRAYHSETFNQEVAAAANLKERSLREFVTDPDGKERRRVLVVPRVNLPAAFEKILNGRPISYEEITVYNPATRSASFAIESTAGDRVAVAGEARFTDSPDGVRLRFEGEAEVKVFGVGGLIERYIVREVKTRYELIERLLQKFVDEGRDRTSTPAAARSDHSA